MGKIDTGVELVFGGGNHGILHVKPAVIGIDAPVAIDTPRGIGLRAPVLDAAGIDILRAAILAHGHYHIVAVDVVDVRAIGEAAAKLTL